MLEKAEPTLLAVDVGNTRVKIGRFERSAECEAAAQGRTLPVAGPRLPTPVDVRVFDPSEGAAPLHEWFDQQPLLAAQALVASVNRPGREWVVAALEQVASNALIELTTKQLAAANLPIEVRVPEPDKVGIDRLAAAAAANRLRRRDKPAVVVDLGTAITVDLLSADGAFLGGAILPGVAMAARALHQQTDLLPQRPLRELDQSPDAVGANTADAIDAGLFWGAVGAVRELIERQSDRITTPPQVFVTGGAAPSVARLLGGPDVTVRHVPELVLSGIAIADLA